MQKGDCLDPERDRLLRVLADSTWGVRLTSATLGS